MLKSKRIKLHLNEIIITKAFSDHLPNWSKLRQRAEYYQKYGCFDRPIIVDDKYHLIDGYTTYLMAKMFGVQKLDVYRITVDMTINEHLDECINKLKDLT